MNHAITCRHRITLLLILLVSVTAAAVATASPAATPPDIILFQAAGFPTADGPEVPAPVLAAALVGLDVTTAATAEDLATALAERPAGVLVLAYGSAFPLAAWPQIARFLDHGGSLVILGGAPFHVPVTRAVDGAGWRPGRRQPSFARHLLIGPAEEVRPSDFAGPPAWRDLADTGWAGAGTPVPERVYALTVRFATRKDLPGEDGSAGPRDARLASLVHLVDGTGVPRACPLLEIHWLRGDRAGARWVLAPVDTILPAAVIRTMVLRARAGAAELDLRPAPACLRPGELPRVRLRWHQPAATPDTVPPPLRCTVYDETGRELLLRTVTWQGTAPVWLGEAVFPELAGLAPGLYRVEAVRAAGGDFLPERADCGFWVRDDTLLVGGPRLTASRDWLRRDGVVFPVIGTSYMASDVHRKFLLEPDPLVWDRDFAAMARAGVNFVRTGLWTGWSRVMLDPGALDEHVLRALDAFVLTAARHDIVVCFTFFAFLPPGYGGSNPYLDPRDREWQQTLLTAVARRFRGCGWIHYDLINEPSYARPEDLWLNRPMGDEHERAAWRAWLAERHGPDEASLREIWSVTAGDPRTLPRPEDLAHAMVRQDRRPRQALDFTLFSHEVVARWAADLRHVLRATTGDDVLVTVGQDEGGTMVRPAQQILAAAVDYTGMHTWWFNDHLLWDGVVTKVPEKPSLVQETGLMRLEDMDGNPWRNPAAAAALLDRKLACAFAGRGAGVVEWAWNINPYQPLDNEAVIGLFRPDGTAKPELDVLRRYATFFRQAAPYLADYEADPVVLVLPQARIFAGRPLPGAASQRAVRVLAESCGVVPTVISDLRLTADRLAGARLIICPVPEMIPVEAAAALAAAA
ncbi:MAG: hypothetical protein JXQ27_08525, partial [Acidobacteria bacterium]|nr:hypothetical protein [Acidobacteriota bacterium]